MLSPSLSSTVSGSVIWQKNRPVAAFHPLALSAYRSPRVYSPLALSAKNEHKPERAGVKLLVGAGVCLTYEFALGHYLEFIKIMKQTRPQFSYLHLTKEIMHAKGVVGVWDGFFPWGALQGVAKGSVFAWGHSVARTALTPFVKNDKIGKGTAEVIAGGIGGGFQGFVLSPTLLLKTRVMTDPIFREQMTPLETMSRSMRIGVKVIQKEGVAALMKGSGMFSVKRVADWSSRFFFSVQAENIVYKRNNPDRVLTTSEQVISSLIGGVFSAALTLPMDVLVAQIQQASKAGVKVPVVELFRQQYRAGGLNQVLSFGTTGFVARLLHASFTTMIMKTATSVVYDMVEGRN
ncbi:Mitochondrial Carrier (MC) Family [Phytophthora nicotianae]|uniref:DnaJ subfamily C member 13 n=1 Tax=Phytophthora nicotianae TaxID=4792 RepID=A0A0W8DTD0_PHYNI|nr:Mitochondrial Carrier (MC) Family [Phytophthora nicotianae]KUF99626.1 DnaJ subfamily C member 13 [Phytophthora nicotianae]